jgi:membrane-associated phospholipid phosphatase
VRISEWICLAYFSYLAAAAWIRPIGRRSRARISLGAVTVFACVIGVARLPFSLAVDVLRDWLPGAYVMVGYWLSALFSTTPAESVEAGLLRLDRRVFALLGVDRLVRSAPRAVLEFFEMAYLALYALVPSGVLTLYLVGQRAEVDAYWTAVLVATSLAYMPLPWITLRPPRSVEGTAAIDHRQITIRRFNLLILKGGSIQVNTLPSGHSASAFAAALVLLPHTPVVGLAFGLVALAVAIGSVVGRYHYALDAALGILVAVIGGACGIAAGR